jgi:hypothetical protein
VEQVESCFKFVFVRQDNVDAVVVVGDDDECLDNVAAALNEVKDAVKGTNAVHVVASCAADDAPAVVAVVVANL